MTVALVQLVLRRATDGERRGAREVLVPVAVTTIGPVATVAGAVVMAAGHATGILIVSVGGQACLAVGFSSPGCSP